jgi:hypothetical protein
VLFAFGAIVRVKALNQPLRGICIYFRGIEGERCPIPIGRTVGLVLVLLKCGLSAYRCAHNPQQTREEEYASGGVDRTHAADPDTAKSPRTLMCPLASSSFSN